MQRRPGKTQFSKRLDGVEVTSAIGMQETSGRLRSRRNSLFAQTIIWITGLACMALLLGSLAQAWSNSQLMQRVQATQQHLQELQKQHDDLARSVTYYQDPAVIESEARQQLGYIRPGEHLVILVSSSIGNQQQTGQREQSTKQQGFWQEWLNAFFGS